MQSQTSCICELHVNLVCCVQEQRLRNEKRKQLKLEKQRRAEIVQPVCTYYYGYRLHFLLKYYFICALIRLYLLALLLLLS